MPISTVSDLVRSALLEIGVLAAGETLPSDKGADGLDSLNLLLDQFAAEGRMIFTVTRTTWTIVSGTASYAVGSGAAVNRARPNLAQIEHINFQDTSITPVLELPLLPLTEDAYAAIPQKTLTSRLPTNWYYNPTFPTGTITLWPVPTASTLQGVLYAWTQLAQFAALTDSLSLPPGYARMLIKNLAADMAGQYAVQVTREQPLLRAEGS